MEAHLWGIRLRGRLDPHWRWRARQLRRLNDVHLHFGCGTRILHGWVNVDGRTYAGMDYVCDLRQPQPLGEGSCRLIFTEHVLEHIDRQFRIRVLRELHRLLTPAGTLRIVVPHCGRYAEAYVRNDLEWFRQAHPGCVDKGDGLNAVFVDHFHRFVDDFGTLARDLRAVGFSEVVESNHLGSAIPELRIDSDNDARTIGNLYVEARK